MVTLVTGDDTFVKGAVKLVVINGVRRAGRSHVCITFRMNRVMDMEIWWKVSCVIMEWMGVNSEVESLGGVCWNERCWEIIL